MRRWLKVLLAVLAGILVLLVLNAIVVSNETADAERNIDGAELVDTSTGTVQVLDEGPRDAKAIVLIHGYTGSIHWWEELRPLLAADHRVISVDLLGHGGSDKPGSGYSIENQAAAVAEAVASLGVKDATVVGHSLGGTVATAVAEQSPELAAKVVNIDQAPNDSYEDLGWVDRAGYAPIIGQALNRASDAAPTSLVRGQFEIAFAPDFNIASGFENPDQVVDDLGAMTYTAFTDIPDAEGDYTDARSLDDRLAALEIPVLVIFGELDQVYAAREAIQPYEDTETIQTQVLEGVGHSPQVEDPEAVADLIIPFADAPTPDELDREREKREAAAKKKERQQKKKKKEEEEEEKAQAKKKKPAAKKQGK